MIGTLRRAMADGFEPSWYDPSVTDRLSTPLPAEHWDQEYRAGRWDYLASFEQRARYAIIAGWLRGLGPSAAILDLGCGDGILCDHLAAESQARYRGVDLSAEAIDRARRRPGRSAPAFVCEDIELFSPDVGIAFDAIVFNEVLYYLHDPASIIERYLNWLTPGGMVIASIFAPEMQWLRPRLAGVAAGFEHDDEVVVSRPASGKSWVVKIWSRPLATHGRALASQ